MIRVCVVDDQTLVRQGIRSLLGLARAQGHGEDGEDDKDGIEVVGEAADGEEALALLRRTAVDVVLLDVRMPVLDGIGVLRALSSDAEAPPCIVLTTFDDDELVLRAVAGGARGFLLKDVTLEQLTAAIRTVADGGSLINPAITARVLRGIDRLGAGFDALPEPDPLTKRELEIVAMMAAGYSNREIAKACHVAEGTIKNHISSILSKLGVRDRTRAVLRALHLGLI
jgi:DNA-binding NarL/FixJ family response regulator